MAFGVVGAVMARKGTLAGLCVVSSLLCSSGVASAAEEREENVLLSSLPGLTQPRAVAFDQANDAVLVANAERFSELGEVKVYANQGGTLVGVLPVSEAPPHNGLLFTEDRLGGGIAVDAAGNIYVSDTKNHVVDKFAPKGSDPAEGYTYVCQYSGPGRGCRFEPEVELPTEPTPTFGNVVGLAVDKSENLYVVSNEVFVENGPNQVDEFDAAGADVAQLVTAEYSSLPAPPIGVAADANGDVFIEDEEHQVAELERGPSGAVLKEVVVAPASAGVSGIGFDADSGLLLLSEPARVVEYDPLRAKIVAEFKTTTGSGLFGGIAARETVGSPTGEVFVLSATLELVSMYGSPPPLKPVVESESVAKVTAASAQLRAVIDPKLRTTHYVFQFGVDQSYGDGEVPLPPGGEIEGTQASGLASAAVQHLEPDETYHYRVVATNKEGTVYGPDQMFTTFQAGGGGLPDGRAWEMVSPLDKNGGDIIGGLDEHANQASLDGEKVSFFSQAAFAGGLGNLGTNTYVATRTPNGWATQNIIPLLKSGSYKLPANNPYKVFTPDLSYGLLRNGEPSTGPPIENVPFPGTGAPAGYENFYLRDNLTDAYQALITTTPTFASTSEFEVGIEGATPDLDHIVMGAYRLGTGHVNIELNEWSGGSLTPVNVSIAGAPVSGALLGAGDAGETDGSPHTISADGSRVFWSVHGDEPMFVREGIGSPQPRTMQLPPGDFVDASVSGSKVLLSTGEVFGLEGAQRIADVTAGAGGFVGELGASDDLSKIYFVDNQVLPGVGANSLDKLPQAGEDNLYLYREGAPLSFIGTLAATDQTDWAMGLPLRTTRVTSGGGSIVFSSTASLTGYDNMDAATSLADSEIYQYTEGVAEGAGFGSGTLSCVSCNPSGEPPIGSASVPAGNVTQGAGSSARAYYQSRVLSSDGGRVFFDSPEGLVPTDTNGAQDVYEYQGGRAQLISSGTGGSATFIDASGSGSDVFFTTENELVSGDTDSLADLYDAREPHVAGEQVGPAAASVEPVCTGTGCQGAPAAPPIFATPSSATFSATSEEALGQSGRPSTGTTGRKETAAEIRVAKLKSALHACAKRPKRQRTSCEKSARKRYGPVRVKTKKDKKPTSARGLER
jgi:hypothetical protein